MGGLPRYILFNILQGKSLVTASFLFVSSA
nr:MAG TPA: hypothetical protein [Caudoviricetes sp.]